MSGLDGKADASIAMVLEDTETSTWLGQRRLTVQLHACLRCWRLLTACFKGWGYLSGCARSAFTATPAFGCASHSLQCCEPPGPGTEASLKVVVL